MSYCRWSSMNWMCDVYVFEDVYGGWTTHVAGNRRIVPPIPDIFLSGCMPRFGGTWSDEAKSVVYPNTTSRLLARGFGHFAAFWHNRIHMPLLEVIPSRKIGLLYDGKSFNDPTPGECADRLCLLKSMGYRVPQYAIDELRKEEKDINEQSNNQHE